MNKKGISILTMYTIGLAVLFLISCGNEDAKAKTEAPKEETAVTTPGQGNNDQTKVTDSTGLTPVKATEANNDNTQLKTPVPVQSVEDVKEDISSEANKKASIGRNDSLTVDGKAKNIGLSMTKKPFIPKYGVFPWEPTAENITDFTTAFPDKNTVIRVGFNADQDASMQAVKAQIIKTLKKSGYKKVSDESPTVHPMRVPKDIHYELQRDESVIIWVPTVNQQ